jgi:hypothetical protein
MRKTVYAVIMSVTLFCFANISFSGIPGATDKVKAASLLVPFFEAGIDSATHPEDTLLVVWAPVAAAGTKIHYHVWDVDGNDVGLYGNIDLGFVESWNTSMRGLISVASSAVKTALTDSTGNYYRGFVTIDVVSADTVLNPTETGYPFATGNNLEGWIYYVRIPEGSSNALAMVPIEEVGTSISPYLYGFYSNSDGREEINVDARACAASLATGGSCTNYTTIDRIRSRVFLDSTSLNASTRIILFYWDANRTEGISTYCDAESCDSSYAYKRYNESGTLVQDTTIRLDHVVNIIEVSGTENGFVSIWDIADPTGNWNVYAFSITKVQPASGPSTNWDAILESYINP